LATRGGFIHFEWDGLEELEDLLDDMEKNLVNIVKEEYTDFGGLVEEAVRALMPRDGSDLEGSYNVSSAQVRGNEISIEGGSNSEYALRRHEEPYRGGSYPKYDNGAKYPHYYVNGRGARTRSKPGFRGEKAGRKYQERAVKLIEKDFDKMNKDIIERVTQGRR